MIQDEHVSLPNRRTTTTTTSDHAERVQSELLGHALARQAYEQQQHASIPTRRERMYSIRKETKSMMKCFFFVL